MDNNTPPIVKTNFKKLKDGFVETRQIQFLSQEYTTYNLIKKGFCSQTGKCCGDGESAAMALAYLNNGIVASNNLSDVEEYIESLDIELITSSMILSKAVEKDIVSEDIANGLWKGMLNFPVLLRTGIRKPKKILDISWSFFTAPSSRRFVILYLGCLWLHCGHGGGVCGNADIPSFLCVSFVFR